MIGGIVFNFFFGKFIEAFIIGVVLRILLALILREKDVSFWGFFNTGWVTGALYVWLTYYVVVTTI